MNSGIPVMRTSSDRIRHAISFEILGILLVVPFGYLVLGVMPVDVGILALVGSTIATVWTYIYNLMFDHVLQRLNGSVQKTLRTRVIHTVIFEGGLLSLNTPLIAWYLGLTVWAALQMNIAFIAFYLVYTFAFNWMYDKVSPLSAQHNNQTE